MVIRSRAVTVVVLLTFAAVWFGLMHAFALRPGGSSHSANSGSGSRGQSSESCDCGGGSSTMPSTHAAARRYLVRDASGEAHAVPVFSGDTSVADLGRLLEARGIVSSAGTRGATRGVTRRATRGDTHGGVSSPGSEVGGEAGEGGVVSFDLYDARTGALLFGGDRLVDALGASSVDTPSAGPLDVGSNGGARSGADVVVVLREGRNLRGGGGGPSGASSGAPSGKSGGGSGSGGDGGRKNAGSGVSIPAQQRAVAELSVAGAAVGGRLKPVVEKWLLNARCWPMEWPPDRWFDFIAHRVNRGSLSFVLAGANLGCPSTASLDPSYVPSMKDGCGDPLWKFAKTRPHVAVRGVALEPVPAEMRVAQAGWRQVANHSVTFVQGVATVDCGTAEKLLGEYNKPPKGTCCPSSPLAASTAAAAAARGKGKSAAMVSAASLEAFNAAAAAAAAAGGEVVQRRVAFTAPTEAARSSRPGKGGQWVNQIGSLAGAQPKGLINKPTDTETLYVACSTVAELAAAHLPLMDQGRGLDVLFADVEGFEYWALADGLLRDDGDPLATRPKVVVYEDKMLDQVSENMYATLQRDLRNLLAKRGYLSARDGNDNTLAVRLDVLIDAMQESC